MLFWRWESEYRWYEAELMSDLFGDWLIVRRWGGLYSGRHGEKTEAVPDLLSGVGVLFAIDRERQGRTPPYIRVGD